MKTIISILSLFYLVSSFAKADDENPAMITVVGKGDVIVPPDYADITIGVTMSEPSAENASNQVDKISSDIIAYLKQNGVVDHDIQTSYINVSPGFNYAFPNAPPLDFSAEKTVDFSLRDLNKYDSIVQDLFEIGANTLSNVRFQADDIETKMKEARSRAAENAKMIAEDLANSLGYSMGSVFSIEDESSFDHFPFPIAFPVPPQLEEASDQGSSGPSIASGRLTISSSLKAQFFRGDPLGQGEQTEGKKLKKKKKIRKHKKDQ